MPNINCKYCVFSNLITSSHLNFVSKSELRIDEPISLLRISNLIYGFRFPAIFVQNCKNELCNKQDYK